MSKAVAESGWVGKAEDGTVDTLADLALDLEMETLEREALAKEALEVDQLELALAGLGAGSSLPPEHGPDTDYKPKKYSAGNYGTSNYGGREYNYNWFKPKPKFEMNQFHAEMFEQLNILKSNIEYLKDMILEEHNKEMDKKRVTGATKKNSIHMISPVKHGRVWSFTDVDVDLYGEPFVGDINDHLSILTAHIPNAEAGVNILFSDTEFPGYTMTFTWLRKQYNGNTYACSCAEGAESWFCPALLKYFPEAPKVFYAKGEALFVEETPEVEEEKAEETKKPAIV